MIRNFFAYLWAWIVHLFAEAKGMVAFAVDRLSEPSTYGGLVAAIYAGAAYSAPYSWVGIGLGCFFIVKKALKRPSPEAAAAARTAASLAGFMVLVLGALGLAIVGLLLATSPAPAAAPAKAGPAPTLEQRVDRALEVCRLGAAGSPAAKGKFDALDRNGQAETIFVCAGYEHALEDVRQAIEASRARPSAAPAAEPGRQI